MKNQKNYYESLPKKRMAVGVLFLDEGENLLILKPTYKEHWSVPGGVVDENESPRRAALREVKEEIGLDISDVKLLCLDYMSREASGHDDKAENLQFLFWGGTLDPGKIKGIKLPQEELSEYKFLPIKDALALISLNLARRIPKGLEALKNNTAYYLEDGELVD